MVECKDPLLQTVVCEKRLASSRRRECRFASSSLVSCGCSHKLGLERVSSLRHYAIIRKLRTHSQDDLLDYRSIISPTKPGVGGFPAKLGRGDKVATYTTLDIATICCSPRNSLFYHYPLLVETRQRREKPRISSQFADGRDNSLLGEKLYPLN